MMNEICYYLIKKLKLLPYEYSLSELNTLDKAYSNSSTASFVEIPGTFPFMPFRLTHSVISSIVQLVMFRFLASQLKHKFVGLHKQHYSAYKMKESRSMIEMRREIKIRFKIREEKAIKIAEKLLDLFYGRKEFFKDYLMPEYIPPRNLIEGSREHALYLTYVISIDYMTDAEKLWRNSRRAYELYPERFKPEGILALDKPALERFVRQMGARFASAGASTWRRISKILLDKYDSDPRNITKRTLTIKEIKGKLDEFPYLRGKKLSSFYIRAMGEKELFKIKNFDELDIPVDIQVARFTIYTGVLKLLSDRFEGCVHEDPLRGLIEEAWRNAAKAHNTYPWKLDEPIWTIGSKLCTKRKCNLCPVEQFCDKAKGIKFKNGIIIWEKLGY